MRGKPGRIGLENVGQIKSADIELGDLTVLVGPQATGKSIFLQWLKLVVDAPFVRTELQRFGIDWEGSLKNFIELYFGEGMSGIWKDNSRVAVDGEPLDPHTLIKGRLPKQREERLFFIPAQRVMSLRDGGTRPFGDYRSGDPFALREFSEKLHHLVQSEFGQKTELFPQKQRMRKELRDPIAKHIFGGFGLNTNAERWQKRVVLTHPDTGDNLPYLVWSAGQREFVPLLLGFYWLMPSSKVSKRGNLEWVVIEELEMGLHPNGISAVLLQVMELLRRGYRVCLSTHSPHVLDVVWALQIMKRSQGQPQDVLNLFGLRSTAPSKTLASEVLGKKLKVHFFTQEGTVKDISNLDPGAETDAEAGWGGISEFSGHVASIVSDVVTRFEMADTR